MHEHTPNFDTLPGMVYGLKQQVSELTTKIDNLLNTKSQALPDEVRINGDKELANYLKFTIQKVSRQSNAGKIPFHREGRKQYYLRSEIDLAFKGRV